MFRSVLLVLVACKPKPVPDGTDDVPTDDEDTGETDTGTGGETTEDPTPPAA